MFYIDLYQQQRDLVGMDYHFIEKRTLSTHEKKSIIFEWCSTEVMYNTDTSIINRVCIVHR